MSEPSISFTIATLLAAETNLPIAEGTQPTRNPVYLTDGAARHIVVETTTSSKGKVTTKIDVCSSHGAPYNAHAPGGTWVHGKAWNAESIVASFMYLSWRMTVEYWDACDYARAGMKRHYDDRCQIADNLATVGDGKASHPPFNPGNRDIHHAIHASGPNWSVESFNSEVGYKLVLKIAATDAQALALLALLMERDNPL